MFCRNCGEEIEKDVSICPHCGSILKKEEKNNDPVLYQIANDPDGLSIASIITSVLVCFVGLILSIISLVKHKQDPKNDVSKKLATIALIVSIVTSIIAIICIIYYQATYLDRINGNLDDLLGQLN